MEDNQNENQEIKPTIEEQLQTSNVEATNLIQNLKITQDEYTKTINDLISKKAEINNILSEIDSAKQTFIDDTNNKLEKYKESFSDSVSETSTVKDNFIKNIDKKMMEYNDAIEDKKEELKVFSTQITNKTNSLETSFNELTTSYTEKANSAIAEIDKKVSETTDILNKEQEDFDKFLADNKTDYDQQYEEIKTLVSQFKASTTESLENIAIREKSIITSQSKIEKIEADLQVIKDSITEYISNMNEKTKEINEKTKQYNQDTLSIIDTNKKQTVEIDKLLRLATGRSLFYSFHKRSRDLGKSQTGWLIALACSIVLFIGFSIWLASTFSKIDWQNVNWFIDVILKFSISAPLLYLLAFVTDRYTKERRLLEEYAFKSTISLALKPYYDMISDENISTEDREFLIKSIENIFTTPTDKVYRTKECQNKIDFAHLSEIQNILKDIDEKIKGNN